MCPRGFKAVSGAFLPSLVGLCLLAGAIPHLSPALQPRFRVFPYLDSELKKKVLNFLPALYTTYIRKNFLIFRLEIRKMFLPLLSKAIAKTNKIQYYENELHYHNSRGV